MISAKTPPSRMTLSNLQTNDDLEAQFNPTELSEKLQVTYAKLGVLGNSHQVLQYSETTNHAFEFELAFRAFDDTGNRLDDIRHARRYLLSLCYARRGAGSVVGGAPPRVLFVWPGLARLTCVVTGIDIKHTLFNVLGAPVHFSAKLTIEEIRDARLFQDEVLAHGTQRNPDGRRAI